MRRRIALGLWGLAAGVASGADVRVVATSGTVIDGVGIARLAQPYAAAAGGVYFLGTSTTLRLPDALVATSDPLPAPLRGTINEISRAVSAGMLVGILADTNGPDVADAIFVRDGGVLRPAVVLAPSDARDIQAFAMNAHGDLAFRVSTATAGEMYVQPHGSPAIKSPAIKVGDAARRPKRVPEPVIDATGAVAWATEGTVSYWDAVRGVRQVTGGTLRFERVKRTLSALAIDGGGVAVITRDEAFLWSSVTGERTILARRRDRLPNKGRISRFRSVGFLPDGTVVLGVSGPRLPGYLASVEGVLTGSVGPGTFSAGTALAPETSTAVFRLDGTTHTRIVGPGDAVAGGGTIRTVESYIARERMIALVLEVTDRGLVIARWHDGTIRPLLADGDRIGADAINLSGALVTLRGGAIAVTGTGEGPVLVAHNDGALREIRTPRRKRFQDLSIEDMFFTATRLFVLGRAEAGGLFAPRGRRLRPVGAASRGLASVELAATDGTSIVLVGVSDSGQATAYRFRDGARRVLADLPGVPSALTARGKDVVALLLMPQADGTTADQLVVVRDTGIHALVTAHDASPIGTIDGIEDFAIVGDRVVFSARLGGDGVRRALLSVGLR